jgi:hypothetical protein
MQRQHLLKKANKKEYEELFRMMSPVSTLYWTRPGDPPVLVYRAAFDDLRWNDEKRSRREILKRSFQKGGIGYVHADELELFAGLYRTDLGKLTKQEYELLNLLEHEGSMNLHELKEVTGILIKDLTPILHRLQEGFKVFEDQRDREWDRNWYAFENEFPEVDVKRYTRIEALKIVLMRFAQVHVCFDSPMVRSFYQLPKEDIAKAIKELVNENQLVPFLLEGSEEFMAKEDFDYLSDNELPEMPKSIFLLHRNDFLVKSLEHELKKQFTDSEHGLLFFLLIDGEFKGAIFGRFTFGPIELRKLKLAIPPEEAEPRKEDVKKAILGEIPMEDDQFAPIWNNKEILS